MNKKARYQELLKKRERARRKLSRALEALGAGSWHEDSTYELAEQDEKVWSQYLDDIEKELEELEKDLEVKRGPKV